MTLLDESIHDDATLAALVGESLRELTKLKGSVTLVAPTSLPNDGKVIDDRRPIA